MRKTTLITLIFVLSIINIVKGQYENHYQGYYDYTEGWSFSEGITKNLNGDGYVMATYGDINGTTFFGLLDINNSFSVNWSKQFKQTTYPINQPSDIATDYADDSYIACGNSKQYWVTGGFITKFDASGNILWNKNYTNIQSLNAIITIENNPSIKYVACGQDYNSHAVVFGIDNYGNVIWAKRTTNLYNFKYTDLVEVKYGDILLIGSLENYSGNLYSVLTRIKKNGTIVYSKKYTGNNGSSITFNSITYNDEFIDFPGVFIGANYARNGQYSEVCFVKAVYYNGSIAIAKRYSDINNPWFYQNKGGIIKLKTENELALINDKYETNSTSSDTSGLIIKMDTVGNIYSSTFFTGKKYNHLLNVLRNNDNDGYVMSGYCVNAANVSDYSPYIVESYATIKKDCKSKNINPKSFQVYLNASNVSHDTINIYANTVNTTKLHTTISNKIICDKILVNKNSKRVSKSPSKLSIELRPTLSRDYINIISNGFAYNYIIYSVNGEIITKEDNITDSKKVIDIKRLATGIYIVKVFTNNEVIVNKFIKQ